jgi:GGDEF domain-containing protein
VKIAEKIFAALSKDGMLVSGAPFSVSIGIAACEGHVSDFARMHREAEAALQLARADGERMGVAPPSEACGPRKGARMTQWSTRTSLDKLSL